MPDKTQLKLGTDLLHMPRLKAMLSNYPDRLPRRVLTPLELTDYRSRKLSRQKLTYLAGRISAKEAALKALGIGISTLGFDQGGTWQEVEILAEPKQKPTLHLHGKALRTAQQLGMTDWQLSLSHDGEYVMATVVGWGSLAD